MSVSLYARQWVSLMALRKSANAGDSGSIPGPGRSPGIGNGNTLQYSCLENSMDWGALQALDHVVTKESEMTEWLSTLHVGQFQYRYMQTSRQHGYYQALICPVESGQYRKV